MIKSIKFDPAFDHKEKGYNGVIVRFVLIGELGCVHFILFTNWNLDHVQVGINGKALLEKLLPKPIELGYFSLFKPLYENQPKSDVCLYLNYAKCYYDGNDKEGAEAFDLLKTRGDLAVWEFMQYKYKEKFGELR